ncbi:MAG: LamG domain-containing protein, partial [Candidatus Woesearchaeota archaeon]
MTRPKHINKRMEKSYVKEISLAVLILMLASFSLLFSPSLTGKVVESGVWITIEDSSYVGGTALFSNTVNSTLIYNLIGNVTLITQTRDDFGVLDVYVDNTLIDSIDLYSPDVVYDVRHDYSVVSELKLVVSDMKNNLSTGNYVVVDEVLGDIIEVTDQEPSTDQNVTENETSSIIEEPIVPETPAKSGTQYGTEANNPPTAGNVTISPSKILSTTSTISATWDYTDLDGNPENASVYEWYVNGTNAWKEGLAGYWKFDQNVLDSIGNNNGIIYKHISNSSGRIKGSYAFDGTDDFIQMDTKSFNFENNSDFTLSLWAKLLPNQSNGILLGQSADWNSKTPGFKLYYYLVGVQKLYFQMGDSISSNTITPVITNYNNWSHYVAIMNRTGVSTTIRLYQNGILLASNTANIGNISSNTTLFMGKLNNTGSWFNGSMDEVMIWNRSLSAQEVSDLYNMTFYGQIDNSGANHTIPNLTNIYNPGTTLTFGVTSYDGIDGYGTQVNVSETVNTVPTIMNVNITSYNLYTTSYPSMMWNYSDVDQDAQNKSVYTWYLNGTEAWRDTSLVGYWKFDSSPYDFVNNRMDAVIYNGTGIQNVTGKIKGAYSFDGDADYVNITNFNSLNFFPEASGFTFSVWIKPAPSLNGRNGIFGLYTSTGRTKNHISLTTAGYVEYDQYDPSGGQLTSTLVPPNDQWTHITVINNLTFKGIYINGVLNVANNTPSENYTGVAPTVAWIGGRWNSGVNYYFNGSIDEVKIWNRSLTAQEIKQEYEMMDYGEIRDPPVSLWHFDESAGRTAKDAIGNNDAVLFGVSYTNNTKFNSGLRFDTDDYVNASLFNFISCGKDYALSMWLKADNSNPAVDQTIWTNGITNTDRRAAEIASNSIAFGNATKGASGTITSNVWYHVVYMENATSIYLYINGVKQTGTTAPYANNADRFYLGTSKSVWTDNFTGNMDEIIVYNRTLTTTEISDLYNLSRPLYSLDESVINKGTTVKLQIEPNDNAQFGTAVNSTQLTVQDTSPTANNVTIKPRAINNTVTSIAGTWDYADADNEPENASVYEWYINGTNAWRDNSLVGYWKFDHNALDSAGSNHGSVIGTTNNLSGKIKDAYHFDGNGDYVKIGDVSDMRVNDLSLCAWIKPENTALDYAGIISKTAYSGDNNRWSMYIFSNKLSAFLKDNNSQVITANNLGSNILLIDRWYYACSVFDRDLNLTIYLDGIKDSSIKISTANGDLDSTFSLVIGAYEEATSVRNFNGSIDEVRIWNRSLSAQEISDLYNQTFYGQIDNSGANHTINNVTLNYYQSAGTNLTFGVTPYNGLVYGNQSNSSTIMVYDVISPNITIINITDL